MNTETIKRLFDACFQAKNITEMIPELPEKMKPRHIHVIDAIYVNTLEKGTTRVSDVSKKMKITTPSVTKLINELEERKIVIKIPLLEDKRITLVDETEKRINYYLKYVKEYHEHLSVLAKDMNEEECKTTIKAIEKFYKIISKDDDRNGSK